MKSTILLRKPLNISLKTAINSCLYLEYVELKSEKNYFFYVLKVNEPSNYVNTHIKLTIKISIGGQKKITKVSPAQFQVAL